MRYRTGSIRYWGWSLAVALQILLPAATQSAQAPDAQSRASLRGEDQAGLQMTVILKAVCDASIPRYRQETAAAYQRWRAPRAQWVDAMEKSPQVLEAVAQARGKSDAAELQKLCRGDLLQTFAKMPAGPADPELATPQKTWNHYVDALRRGDRQAAIGCLASTARDTYLPILQQSSAEQMQAMAAAVVSFSLTGDDFSHFAEAAVTLKGGRSGLVYFVNDNGEWRIGEM